MYMEVLFPCIWKFSMYMESLSMYMEVLHPCIWRFPMYMEFLHPCIYKFSMYMESISMYMEAFFFRMEFRDFGLICHIQGCPAKFD